MVDGVMLLETGTTQGGAHEHIAEAKRVPAPIGGNVSFSLYLSFKA